MIKPIPLENLIHSVSYEQYQEKDRYGNQFKDPITLEKVLVQPTSNIKRSNNTDQVGYKALMFFDCVHSSPGVEFVKKSKVTLNGETMIVDKINPIYSFGLHHYELELI